MTIAIMPTPKLQFIDENGNPYSGGKVYTYEPGTTTLKDSYTDSTGGTANANPVVLDSAGRASIWLDGYYKIVLYTSADVLVYTVDNVSGSPATTVIPATSQWIQQDLAYTYVDGTSFTVPGDYTDTFQPGRRVLCTCTAGSIYGTVSTSTHAAGTTTVVVVADSGQLDSGLSTAYTSILTAEDQAVPTQLIVTKTAAYTLLPSDINKIFISNSASNYAFTIPTASTIPSGGWYRIKNINTGTLTLTGTIDGIVNPTLAQYDEAFIFTNGSAWYGNLQKRYLSLATLAEIQAMLGIQKIDTLAIVNNTSTPNSKVDVTIAKIWNQETVSFTIDMAASGANGLDTGAEAASTWYYIWAIYNGATTVAGLLSASATAPTLPSGYTYKQLIGAVYNSSGSNFVAFSQRGNKVMYSVPTVVKSNSFSANAWTELSCAIGIPAIANKIQALFDTEGSVLGLALNATGKGICVHHALSTAAWAVDYNSVLASRYTHATIYMNVDSQTLFYWTNHANSTLSITGWEFTI